MSFAHFGPDGAAGFAIGLALLLGFLLGAAEIFSTPPVESVIAAPHERLPVAVLKEMIRAPL